MVGNNSDNPDNGKLPMASRWTANKPTLVQVRADGVGTPVNDNLLVGEDEER